MPKAKLTVTVAELASHLATLPQNLEVCIASRPNSYGIDVIQIPRTRKLPIVKFYSGGTLKDKY